MAAAPAFSLGGRHTPPALALAAERAIAGAAMRRRLAWMCDGDYKSGQAARRHLQIRRRGAVEERQRASLRGTRPSVVATEGRV